MSITLPWHMTAAAKPKMSYILLLAWIVFLMLYCQMAVHLFVVRLEGGNLENPHTPLTVFIFSLSENHFGPNSICIFNKPASHNN